MTLPPGYSSRPARPDDPATVAAVLLADDLQDTGLSVYDVDFVADQWSAPGFEPEVDAWLVTGPDGDVVAAGSAIPAGDAQVRSWGVVHPDHRGRGVGSWMLDRIQTRAEERLRGVAGATFHHSINDVDEAARGLVLARGLTLVRSFRHMQIDLQGRPDPGPAPPGITIRGIEPAVDLARAHAVIAEAFAQEWGYQDGTFQEWLAQEVDTEGYDPTLWLLATEGDEAVGALNAIVRGDRGWVGELGVRSAWRGRGIATALLRRSFATFAERGLTRVMLNVDFENPTGATALYEKLGMRAVRGYDVYELALG